MHTFVYICIIARFKCVKLAYTILTSINYHLFKAAKDAATPALLLVYSLGFS